MANKKNNDNIPQWSQSEGYMDNTRAERSSSAIVILSSIMIVLLLAAIVIAGTKLSDYLQNIGGTYVPQPSSEGSISLTIRDSDYSQGDNGFSAAEVYALAEKSIVRVRVYASAQQVLPTAECVGAILSEDGYILVNAFFLRGAAYVEVIDSESVSRSAALVGYDALSDIGIIKVNATKLTPVSGNSLTSLSGERVVSVVTLNGLSQSVCEDTVAAASRTLSYMFENMAYTDNFIQTGNDSACDGGLLFNRFGEFMGLYSSSVPAEYTQQCGFAVPVKYIISAANSIIANGFVSGRTLLPFTVADVPQFAAYRHGISSPCLLITETQPDIDSGISAGMLITTVNGSPCKTTEEFLQLMRSSSSGTVLTLALYNPITHDTETVQLTLSEQRGLWPD